MHILVHACAYVVCISAGCENDFVVSYFKKTLNLIIYYFYEVRSIVIITITILALEPYRHATFSLFSRKKWTSEVKSIQTLHSISIIIYILWLGLANEHFCRRNSRMLAALLAKKRPIRRNK
ncbi:unnamed protein product [Wuchereria bancrofti]|uniref:Uncharacterized protein n=1 Tax=Wuchereria bancrofti TaxID=6293 RepID=A0A3P7DV90_WUCBA|nr:unnamed protein product [Wuchereria bancrofti]